MSEKNPEKTKAIFRIAGEAYDLRKQFNFHSVLGRHRLGSNEVIDALKNKDGAIRIIFPAIDPRLSFDPEKLAAGIFAATDTGAGLIRADYPHIRKVRDLLGVSTRTVGTSVFLGRTEPMGKVLANCFQILVLDYGDFDRVLANMNRDTMAIDPKLQEPFVEHETVNEIIANAQDYLLHFKYRDLSPDIKDKLIGD